MSKVKEDENRKRNCLKCRRSFVPVDWIRNRICKSCNKENEQIRVPREIGLNSISYGRSQSDELD